jgi:hypothetical protein
MMVKKRRRGDDLRVPASAYAELLVTTDREWPARSALGLACQLVKL